VATVHSHIDAPLDDVFAALVDPRTYPSWLIGAKDIREVEDAWPAPGSRFHHRVGVGGPLTVADSTEVLEIDPPALLRLRVRARPLGRGEVSFRLHRLEGGQTCVELEEHPVGALAWAKPLLDVPTAMRNRRSLEALGDHLTRSGGPARG
jgi:uncharacterized protein YndB with AHSA1/START domain